MFKRLAGWLKTILVVGLGLLALAILWDYPLAGHHHMELRGLLGWLSINGEEPDPRSMFYWHGKEYVPTWFGLPPTLAATYGIGWLVWKSVRPVVSTEPEHISS